MSHPASTLLVWIALTLAVQFVGGSGLALLGLSLALSGAGLLARWWRLLRRARWLLLSLCLILAFGTPGEIYFDHAWSPTDAGLWLAGLHGLRLALMLGLLAWLFQRLDQQQLIAGLWWLARPLQPVQVAVDRLVVRLALLFDYLEKAPPKGSWKHLLRDDSTSGTDEAAAITLELAAWATADTILLLGGVALLAGMVWLP